MGRGGECQWRRGRIAGTCRSTRLSWSFWSQTGPTSVLSGYMPNFLPNLLHGRTANQISKCLVAGRSSHCLQQRCPSRDRIWVVNRRIRDFGTVYLSISLFHALLNGICQIQELLYDRHTSTQECAKYHCTLQPLCCGTPMQCIISVRRLATALTQPPRSKPTTNDIVKFDHRSPRLEHMWGLRNQPLLLRRHE